MNLICKHMPPILLSTVFSSHHAFLNTLTPRADSSGYHLLRSAPFNLLYVVKHLKKHMIQSNYQDINFRALMRGAPSTFPQIDVVSTFSQVIDITQDFILPVRFLVRTPVLTTLHPEVCSFNIIF